MYLDRLSSIGTLKQRIQYVHQQLVEAVNAFQANLDSLDIKKLESIAQVRFACTQVAIWMYKLEIQRDKSTASCFLDLQRVFYEVQLLVERTTFNWPR